MATYTVQSGDTLSKIASKYGVDYKTITGYRSGNPNLIYAGENLTIPDSAPKPASPAVAPQPQAPQSQAPQPQPAGQMGSSSVGTPPPYDPNVENQTVDYGGVTWKGNPGQGWTPQSKTGGGSLTGISATPSINLPDLYKSLYASSGIDAVNNDVAALQEGYSKKEQAYNAAISKINDNPFLSEAERTGRLQKLGIDFQNGTANDLKAIEMKQGDIEKRKADIETQLQLQTQQFNINSEQAQQAFQQFSQLLQMGALDNASANDIAGITRSTGLSSAMIQAAVNANRQKNTQTSVIQFDDGKNQGFAVINPQTGEIIKQQVVSTSKPDKYNGLGVDGGGSGGTSLVNQQRQFELDKAQAPALASQAARAGKTLKDMLAFYSQWLDPQTIYQIYNANSVYGVAKEDKKTLSALGIKK